MQLQKQIQIYFTYDKYVAKFKVFAIITQISDSASFFTDMQFPIDVKTVRKDHEFLDGDAIESLFR